MAKSHMWQIGVLMFTFIVCTRSLECPLQGANFGGRLMFINGGGLGSSLFPPMGHRGRMIVFEPPPPHIRRYMASGSGRIFIGSKICQGPGSQQGHCPWNGDRPCLEKGIPCETEPPSYSQPDPLGFSEVTNHSINVSWPAWDQTNDNGVGPVTGYKILYRPQGNQEFKEISFRDDQYSHQVDDLVGGTTYQFRMVLLREGEPPEGPPSAIQNSTTLCGEVKYVNLNATSRPVGITSNGRISVTWELPSLIANCEVTSQIITRQLLVREGCESQEDPEPKEVTAGTRSRNYSGLHPNSKYNITLQVENPAGTHVESKVIWTPAVNGAVNGLRQQFKNGYLWLFYKELSCGELRGVIQYYEVVAIINGEEVSEPGNRKTSKRYKFPPLSSGDSWGFKVRACYEQGCGVYAVAEGVKD